MKFNCWFITFFSFQSLPLDIARVLYERLVRRFPNCGRYWRLFIEQEVFRLYSSLKLVQISDSLSLMCWPKLAKVVYYMIVPLWLCFCFLSLGTDLIYNLSKFGGTQISVNEKLIVCHIALTHWGYFYLSSTLIQASYGTGRMNLLLCSQKLIIATVQC